MKVVAATGSLSAMKKIILMSAWVVFMCQNASAGFFDFSPAEKLKEADYMMSINRGIAADKLINDVLVFCNKKNDEKCLATAYFYCGKLLLWRVPDEYFKTENISRKIPSYLDKNLTLGNVNQKCLECFEKALELAKKHEMDANISAIYIKLGILQFTRFKDQVSACESFDQSLRYNLRFQKNNPGQKVVLTKGFSSFEEYIDQGKREMGCGK